MSRNPLAGDPLFLAGCLIGCGVVLGAAGGWLLARRWT